MVIIYICHISPHGSRRNTGDHVHQVLLKCSVMIIEIQVIPFKKIIGHINIHPSILINISDGHPKAKTDHTAINTGLCTNIREMIPVISEKFIPAN